MRGFSIELAPTALLRAGGAAARLLPQLPAGTRVYLPSLPADPPDAITRALELLRRENGAVVGVPHIPATRVASASELEERLCAWQRATADGVSEVLVVRGDPHAHDTGSGSGSSAAATAVSSPFRRSLDLLETGMLQRCGVGAVSLCGHPEGVGGLSVAEARLALGEKLSWAEAAGLPARVVTQFCFDASATAAYVDGLREAGVGTAVSLGVVGPSSRALRTRMAERCGVGGEGSSAEAGVDCWPSAYMRSLAGWQAARGPTRGAQMLHAYPFGGLEAALGWLGSEEVRELCGGDGE